MDIKIARKWARALESGLYPQAQGALRRDGGLCCLGVLCSLHAEAHPDIAAAEVDPSRYMGEDCELPQEVQDWAGMDSASGFFHAKRIKISSGEHAGEEAEGLIDLNDEYDFTFKQIAKVIRQNAEQL